MAVHAIGENGGKFVWNHDTLELTTCTSDPSFEGAIMENIYNPLFALTVNQGIHFSAQDVRDLMQYNELYCDETIEYSVNDRPSPTFPCLPIIFFCTGKNVCASSLPIDATASEATEVHRSPWAVPTEPEVGMPAVEGRALFRERAWQPSGHGRNVVEKKKGYKMKHQNN